VSFDDAMQTVQQWSLTAEALGALAAHATLLSEVRGDPGVRDRLQVLAEAAGLPDLDTVEPPQRMMLAALARSALKQALDLLEDPDRAPGWAYSDAGVLDGWGRGSAAVPGMIAKVAPEIGQVTSLLDVGTGVGLLAVAATQIWPEATVVGIDTWQPSLDRASKNVADAGLADRIELRHQDVCAMTDHEQFDCIWVPTFFLTEPATAAAVPALVRALRPGGWIVLGRFLSLPDPVAAAMLDLRTYRFGGSLLSEDRSVELLAQAGCDVPRVASAPPPMRMAFTIAQKPAQ
jgi:ubiquinone/menaquinone biosynthesis C-methylase UbiE